MLFLIIVLAVVLIVFLLVVPRIKQKAGSFPYDRNEVLFSPAERSFLAVLDQAAAPEYRVFGKVRIADVVDVSKSVQQQARLRAFNKISAKHFDYVLCRADDLSIVCAVELDDKSHARQKTKIRDHFVEGVCEASGLPLMRVPARHAYVLADIKQQLMALLVPATVEAPLEAATAPVEAKFSLTPIAPACPKCAGTMQRRRIQQGTNAGSEFWGCDGFPACRGTLATSS